MSFKLQSFSFSQSNIRWLDACICIVECLSSLNDMEAE